MSKVAEIIFTSCITEYFFGHHVGITNIHSTFDKNKYIKCHEMKLGLLNYAVTMPI
jgi:hypothetical protein